MVFNPVTNPVIGGFNPDPSICRVGSDYFLATSTFEYFPGVPIYHSRDLVNWTVIGHALTRPSQLYMPRVEPSGGIFAPTLRYWKGRFYMATCCVYRRNNRICSESRGFYVHTDDIFDSSKWSDPIWFDALGIDQDLFFDEDDKVYLCTSRHLDVHSLSPDNGAVITGCEIDLETGRSLTTPKVLWQSLHSSLCTEGPHIFKRDGYYYLLVAEGGTHVDHQTRIYRSKSPMGPYDDAPPGINPVIFNGPHPVVQNCGHADIVEDVNGNSWVFFLAVRMQPNGNGPMGRETFMAPLEWNEQGWPVVNKGRPITLDVVDATKLSSLNTYTGWRDSFSGKALDINWYNLRVPVKPHHALKNGQLTLYGNAFTIANTDCPAMLLIKQVALSGTWSTTVDFEPSTCDQEAGAAVYWSCYAYAAILVRKSRHPGAEREVVMRWIDENSDDVKTLEIIQPLSSKGPVNLRIEAKPVSYSFSFQAADDSHAVTIGSVSTAVLDRSGPSDSPYTGAHFGIFAQGTEGVPCSDEARFTYAAFDV